MLALLRNSSSVRSFSLHIKFKHLPSSSSSTFASPPRSARVQARRSPSLPVIDRRYTSTRSTHRKYTTAIMVHSMTNGTANGTADRAKDTRPVFFFDIDNCLYPKSKRVHDLMSDLIDKYFETHLSLSRAEANELHMRYYKDYGLAIEGLVRHHKVDPMEYNRLVDDALPLEDVLAPNPQLRRLLEDLDTDKVKPWLFTNAYITHGKRVVRLLGVEDLFEGITYCDYAAPKLLCKPAKEMFKKAMREAGVEDPSDCYFVGRSS